LDFNFQRKFLFEYLRNEQKFVLFLYLVFIDSTENKTENVPEKLVCESCGLEFSCGANIGKCWCFTVDVKAETLAELRENFKSCLCENCLVDLAIN
jgi:hypothetical protein